MFILLRCIKLNASLTFFLSGCDNNKHKKLNISGGLYGDDGGQSTSQTKFESADNKVDVATQTDFDDVDRSMIVNVGSDSDGYYGDSELSDSSEFDTPQI